MLEYVLVSEEANNKSSVSKADSGRHVVNENDVMPLGRVKRKKASGLLRPTTSVYSEVSPVTSSPHVISNTHEKARL